MTNDQRARRIAARALLGLLLGAAACDEPAKSAADAKDGGASRGADHSGDKSHCAGDER